MDKLDKTNNNKINRIHLNNLLQMKKLKLLLYKNNGLIKENTTIVKWMYNKNKKVKWIRYFIKKNFYPIQQHHDFIAVPYCNKWSPNSFLAHANNNNKILNWGIKFVSEENQNRTIK